MSKRLMLDCDRHPDEIFRQAIGRVVVQRFGGPALAQDICQACLEQLTESFSRKPTKNRQLERTELNLLARKLRRLLKADPRLRATELRKHLGVSAWHMHLIMRHARKVGMLVKGRKVKLA